MATHKLTTRQANTFTYNNTAEHSANSLNLIGRYFNYVDGQKPYSMGWWLLSLMLHGCILVPLTFLLVYSLGGPTILFLGASMSLFFINVIANMGAAPFRFTFTSFVVSLLIHAGMALSVLL